MFDSQCRKVPLGRVRLDGLFSDYAAHWSRAGRELFFRSSDGRIMVASYTMNGDAFLADKPRVWSEKPVVNTIGVRSYDVAPDGKRIAALMPVETAESQRSQNHIVMLINFFDELRRKVPVYGK